jgi:chemotaxis protein methyltransferase WspC
VTAPLAPAAPLALEIARGLADRGALDEAHTHAERAVRDAVGLRAGAEAYALLGTIESARGRPDDAVRAWQRAVYLDATHEAATVSLATALRARGDTARADALLRAWSSAEKAR